MSVAGTQTKKHPAPQSTEPKTVFKGLCANCNNAGHCSYAKNARKPVMYCEMHDSYAPAPAQADLSEVLRPDPADLRPVLPKSKGLCVNCANREDCVYAQREGGVWHCEMYR